MFQLRAFLWGVVYLPWSHISYFSLAGAQRRETKGRRTEREGDKVRWRWDSGAIAPLLPRWKRRRYRWVHQREKPFSLSIRDYLCFSSPLSASRLTCLTVCHSYHLSKVSVFVTPPLCFKAIARKRMHFEVSGGSQYFTLMGVTCRMKLFSLQEAKWLSLSPPLDAWDARKLYVNRAVLPQIAIKIHILTWRNKMAIVDRTFCQQTLGKIRLWLWCWS